MRLEAGPLALAVLRQAASVPQSSVVGPAAGLAPTTIPDLAAEGLVALMAPATLAAWAAPATAEEAAAAGPAGEVLRPEEMGQQAQMAALAGPRKMGQPEALAATALTTAVMVRAGLAAAAALTVP